jgi:hypothetical protein
MYCPKNIFFPFSYKACYFYVRNYNIIGKLMNTFVNFKLVFLKVTWRWLSKTKLGSIYKSIQNDGVIRCVKNHALECKFVHDLKQTWWILKVMFEMMLEEIWLCNFSKMFFRRWFTLPLKNCSNKGM